MSLGVGLILQKLAYFQFALCFVPVVDVSYRLPLPATMPMANGQAFLPWTLISMGPKAEINSSFYNLPWS